MNVETSNTDSDSKNEPGTGTGTGEVLLDVCPLIERGEEPFATIMQTVATLDGRALVLVAPFEPTPLQGVLSSQGFTYDVDKLSDDRWRVRFQLAPPAPTAAASSTSAPVGESPYTIKPRTPSGSAAPIEPSVPTLPQSVMAMNPTLNVPPAWLPLSFMLAAGIGLIGFAVAVINTAPTVVFHPRADHVIAAVHFGVLAFLSTAVLGALHQFGPVVGARPLRSTSAGVVAGVLFVPGAWIIPIGFATGHMGVVQVGGVLATSGVCVAAWNLSKPLSSSGKGVPIVGLRLAVLYLVLTAAFGVTYAFDRGHFWFALLPHRVLAHAHLGLLGWLGLAYVAVAEKLWPMFLLAHRPHARAGERAVWLVGVGAPIVTIGLLFSWRPVTIVGGALVVAGLCFHLSSLASVIRHRRRNLELLHGFVLGSAVCLAIAMVIGVVAGLAPMSAQFRMRLVAAEVLSLMLWLALAVIGHSHKIVPFISWNRLRDRGITEGREGRPLLFADLVDQRAARLTFALALLGAGTGLLGMLTATSWAVRLAGISLGLVGLITVGNLVSGPLLMIRWHDHRRPTNQQEAS